MFIESQILKQNIDTFKLAFLSKDHPYIFEANKFDIMIDKVFKFLKFIYNISNNIIIKILRMIKKSISVLNQFLFNLSALEKKIAHQEKLISENIKINNELSFQVNALNKKLSSKFKEETSENSGNKNPSIEDSYSNKKNSKIEFFQEENVRLSNLLHETNKKFEIMKEEIEKYEKQRSNLISKLNSVNDEITDTNVLTNVFKNKVNEKINIIDHPIQKNIKNNNEVDLNEEVSKIFNIQNK